MARIDAGLLPREAVDRLVRACLPAQLRPKSVCSPLKAAAWRNAGLAPPEDGMPTSQFQVWRSSPACRAAVATNVGWILDRHNRSKARGNAPVLATAADWHSVLQAAYDFDLPDVLAVADAACRADRPWTPQTLALFNLVW
jgi:hypothetical protein